MERSLEKGSLSPSTNGLEGRRCKDWLATYVKWQSRTDAPKQYRAWSGVFAIASALERRVILPERYLATWECYPFMYMMFVGDPGMRKTTMALQAAKLLEKIPSLIRGPKYATKEFIVKSMIEKKPQLYLVVEEFSDLFQKNKNKDMIEFLTSTFDAPKFLSEGTRKRDVEMVANPCLNMVAGTTYSWINENMGGGVIGGGYSSRCVWVSAQRKDMGTPKILFDKVSQEEADSFIQMEEDLWYDLSIIAELEGEMLLTRGWDINRRDKRLEKYGDEDSGEWLEQFNREVSASMTGADNNLDNLKTRRSALVIKLAMIHSVSVRNDLVITVEDFEFAKRTINSTDQRMDRVVAGMGRNPYVEDITRIAEYVRQNEPVEDSLLRKVFEPIAEARMLNDILISMNMTDRIKEISSKGGKKIWVSLETYNNFQKEAEMRRLRG